MHKYTRYFHLLFLCFICTQPNIRVLLHIQMKYTTILSIAGSDCSGGAGIQADIKTISALGCYAASIVTAVTVQNTCGVKNVYPIPAQIVKEQIQAITEDMQIDALKIGMVTDESIIAVIADFLSANCFPVVFDPVLVSSSGYSLVAPEALHAMCDRLIPHCTLMTPNLPEAEIHHHRYRRKDWFLLCYHRESDDELRNWVWEKSSGCLRGLRYFLRAYAVRNRYDDHLRTPVRIRTA